MKIENITNLFGQEVVNIFYEDGRQESMLKSTWDELEAQREQSGIL